jgi:hypothetical protein
MCLAHLLAQVTHLAAQLSPLLKEIPETLSILFDSAQRLSVPHSRSSDRADCPQTRDIGWCGRVIG